MNDICQKKVSDFRLLFSSLYFLFFPILRRDMVKFCLIYKAEAMEDLGCGIYNDGRGKCSESWPKRPWWGVLSNVIVVLFYPDVFIERSLGTIGIIKNQTNEQNFQWRSIWSPPFIHILKFAHEGKHCNVFFLIYFFLLICSHQSGSPSCFSSCPATVCSWSLSKAQ